MTGDEHQWHYDYPRLAYDAGFNFETYRSKSLDQIIGSANVEQIIRERNVAEVEKCIPAVVEFSLDNDQTSVLDPTFVKIFRISQLGVQYLLFCKKYLDNSVILIKQEYQKSSEENKNLKRQIDEFAQESSNYKKQIKELKLSLNTQVAAQNTGVFQCQECTKAFSTEEYLLAHVKRRHESLGIVVAPSNSSFQAETDKLQLEIKELKERLNSTERFVSNNELVLAKEFSIKAHPEPNTFVTELQDKFERLKTHVDGELRVLQSQKFEKEKYEKWFETFLSSKLSTACKDEKPVMATTGCQGEIITNNCGTQTESFVTIEVCEKCQNGDGQRAGEARESKKKVGDEEKKLQHKLEIETQNRLQKFEEIIEEKVSGSLEKLANQMQTFLFKITDLEDHKVKSNTSLESVEEVIVKPPKTKKHVISTVPVRNVSLSPLIKKPAVTKRPTVVKKFCSSSSESESNESSESEDELIIKKPVIKVSATSTLGRRSLTSLKQAAFTPQVLAQLQKEIEKVMEKRLHEVGVDPKLKRLPVRPYQQALETLSHQASLVQKNISNYMQIRRQISKDANNKIENPTKNSSKLCNLLNSFRNQAKSQTLIRPPNVDSTKMLVDLSETEESSVSVKPSNNTFVINEAFGVVKNPVSIPSDGTDSESIKHHKLIKTTGPEAHTKSVLRNNPVVNPQPKKRVIFDLNSPDSKENLKPVLQNKLTEAGSTTSIASSVLDDGSKASLGETQPLREKTKEMYDSSDFELSEVSTN